MNFGVRPQSGLFVFTFLVVFNAIFNNISVTKYIVAVSFIGGGNLITSGKPPACCKSLTNFIT